MTEEVRRPLLPIGPRLVDLGAAVVLHRGRLSQRELADRLGVEQRMLAHWEAGHVDLTVESVRELEVVLGIPHGTLFVEAGYVSCSPDRARKGRTLGTLS
ncbi:MAG: helix-turn-helix transcriptional regulator [Actinobacteria bacterium]|nr:helix-turn-helix transcriptional regulator [Actinomycetota bacterium]